MKYREHIVKIQVKDLEMLGIISLPGENTIPRKNAVLIITGGAQYRIGSHRQFTRMARRLSEAGYPVMRFDMPGMGDSLGTPVLFDQTAPHIAAAMDILSCASSVQKICLWGICDGASASLLYVRATHDERISGLVLLNPWIRSDTNLARAYVKYYYPRRLLDIEFWLKLLRGKISFKSIGEFLENLFKILKTPPISTTQSLQDKMAQGWEQCKKPILLLLSERDLTAQEFSECIKNDKLWITVTQTKSAEQYILWKADHTCSAAESHNQLVTHTLLWLNSIESNI